MLTEEAIREEKGPVRVLVSEPHQKMNIEKCAKDHGRKTVTTKTEDGFAVTIEP